MATKKSPVFLETPVRLRIGIASPVDLAPSWEFGTVLVPTAQPEGGIVTVGGPILDASGISYGRIKIGGIPIDMLRQKKPAGRKSDHGKKVKVFLAWLVGVLAGDSRDTADQQVADLLDYSDARQVKAIRAAVCKEFSLSAETLNFIAPHPEPHPSGYEWICLAKFHSHERPTQDSLHIRLIGWRWNGAELEKGGMTLHFAGGEEALLKPWRRTGYVTFLIPR